MIAPETGNTPARTFAIQLNGAAVEAREGETILACARRHGVHVPTLCELDDIDHAPGTCRVCVAEVRAAAGAEPQLLTTCNTPVQEGMDVRTRSRRAREAQKLQVELLLADHHQDCATCIRHGNCELQDVAQYVGLRTNRWFSPTRVASRPVDDSSPAMIRDMTKCIRCQRCIAICRDGQGVDALVVTGTGQDTAVGLRDGLSQRESTCVTCGQCVLVCPTGALGERDEVETVVDWLNDPAIVTVFQFAPALRVGLGEEFGLPPGTNVEGQIVAALRRIGADIVLDTNFGADVVIMEESAELLRRLGEGKRPTFTSCCPAWINFAETHYPEILPHLSSTKSPQQTVGILAKTWLPEKMGLDPAQVRMVSLMPCTAKKDEAVRPQLRHGTTPEVDVVLTVREFVRLLRREGVNLAALEPSTFDNPYMSDSSGAGVIFGTTGGVMEAAVRTMWHTLHGTEMEPVELQALRGFDGVRTAALDLGGAVGVVKVAMAHGLKPTRRLVESVLAGTADFDFIEIMACPGGCVDGGGTLRSKKAYLPHALRRRDTLFGMDRARPRRQSHANPQVQRLYREFLERPYSERAHYLLHTWYQDRRRTMSRTVMDIWNDITMSTKIY
ncbi:MAG: [FeFe] hydrogenase, group A [Candidatus Eisenbacteria bacterium]